VPRRRLAPACSHGLTGLLVCDNHCPNQMGRNDRQLTLPIRSRGDRREGAGCKPAPGRRTAPHRRRAKHDRHCPSHVTLRACADVPSLRGDRLSRILQRTLGAANRGDFRVLHFSLQRDHMHLLVEADGPLGFRRGVQGLAVRLAKAVNRLVGRRGRVWASRYHCRLLRTPREVRNALVYVLNNWRKHERDVRGLDPSSSARFFDGWQNVVPVAVAAPVARARTWLVRVGWRRYGAIAIAESPRARSA
jgi:REP element-mobilizing transposase RayT